MGNRAAEVRSIDAATATAVGITHELPFQQELIDQVQKALLEIDAGGSSKGIVLVGPSGTGKTTAIDLIASLYAPYVDGVQRCVPCCRITAAAQVKADFLGRSLLQQLGRPLQSTSKLHGGALEAAVHDALTACRVRIVVFEEMNNALLSGSPQLRGQVSRFLKNLWNQHRLDDPSLWSRAQPERQDKRLVIIVSGTDDVRPAFDRDAELSSRYSCRINTAQLWFHPPEFMRHFRSVFITLVARFGLTHRLGSPDAELLSRCMFACDSHLRRLEALLCRASTLQSMRGSDSEPLELLARSFEEVLQGDVSHDNPFRWSRELVKQRVLSAPKTRQRA